MADAPAKDDFTNESERTAGEQTDSQTAWEVNRKRTYDAYQDFDIQAVRYFTKHAAQLDALSLQAMQNAIETSNMVGKQAIKHADVAADALWTDELNPVTRGAGNDLTGQSPVNPALASTASIMTTMNNLTLQFTGAMGEMVTAIVGLANSQAAQNLALAQLIQNGKQNPTT
jgi:hypothetical protein